MVEMVSSGHNLLSGFLAYIFHLINFSLRPRTSGPNDECRDESHDETGQGDLSG